MPNRNRGDRKAQRARHRQKHGSKGKGDVQAQRARYEAKRPKRERLGRVRTTPSVRTRGIARSHRQKTFIGIDGEGRDTPDGNHIYTYLAAVTSTGRLVREVRNERGLSHEEVREFLIALPQAAIKFAYSFGYDITMWLAEFTERERWFLARPNERSLRWCADCKVRWAARLRKECPKCDKYCRQFREHVYRDGYKYDWFNGSFRVSECYSTKKLRSTLVWDVFRFFQCSFAEALEKWNIGSEDERKAIRLMKARRGKFAEESVEDVEGYCKLECELLARLMVEVLEAHKRADLKLHRYDGVGATASALLSREGVKSYRGSDVAPRVEDVINQAFFGGRFENSVVGPIKGPLYQYDIASAYPYAELSLPCLSCATWHYGQPYHPRKLGVVEYRVKPLNGSPLPWMPLPCRTDSGSIVFGYDFRGFAWSDEFRAALEGWPDLIEPIRMVELEVGCDHTPFAFLEKLYRYRVSLGKDGAGIVIKLGSNATYGKTAQSIGDDPPYRSLAWAGMTTSMTRAQILRAMLRASSLDQILSIATDGIVSREKLVLEKPKTSTLDLEKPLGCWEEKDLPDGVFFAKPGLYFRLKPKRLGDIRARGVGRREVWEQRQKLIDGFRAWNRKDFDYAVPLWSRRFFGLKYSVLGQSYCEKCAFIRPGRGPCTKCRGQTAFTARELTDERGKPVYGRWLMRESLVTFDPRPKRVGVSRNRLLLGSLKGIESAPYLNQTTPEGQVLRELREFLLEQPDWDD